MMFDFNPHIPAFGFNNDMSDPQGPSSQPVNPFVGGSGTSLFGPTASSNPSANKPFNWANDNSDDSMGPDWNKRNARPPQRHFGAATSPMGGFGLGPMASANSNLFWGQQQANTNPFIFY